MRSIATAVCLSLLLAGSLAAQTPATSTAAPAVNANQLLQQGKDDYHAGRYAQAVDALRGASAAFLSPDEKQQYVDTGTLPTLPQVEESLAYLALSYAKLGKNDEARDTIARLANAEKIAPTLAKLPLGTDAPELQAVIARVAPSVAFPQPGQQPPVAVAQATPPVTPVPQPAVAPPPPTPQPAPTQTAQATPAPAPTVPVQAAPTPSDRAAIMQQVEERVAAAQAEIDKEAAAKIAEIRKEADARVAAERAAIDREAQARIDAERAAAQKKADEEIAAARATAEREAQQKIAAERAAAEQAAREKAAAAEAEQARLALTGIRQAESLAEAGNVAEADRAFVRIAAAKDSPRDVIGAAAAGLYRTGDYTDAVTAFQRLGTFARGEEDLRYYYSVSLFETGSFQQAKHELECALPFIAPTPDVERYRAKIEGMPSMQ